MLVRFECGSCSRAQSVSPQRASSGSVACRFCGDPNAVEAPAGSYSSGIGSSIGSSVGSAVGSSVTGPASNAPPPSLSPPHRPQALGRPLEKGGAKASGKPIRAAREVDVFQRRPQLGQVMSGESEADRAATAALILGLVSFGCGGLPAPIALYQVYRAKVAAEAENVPFPPKALIAGVLALIGMVSLMATGLVFALGVAGALVH